jgi:hypothetical protein
VPGPLQVIDGRYEALAELGAGAFGRVFRCHDTRFDREVAVKLMAPGGFGEDGLRRFQEEAAAAARVRDPHVVELLDAGVTEAEEPYLVFELVDGTSMEERLHTEPPPTSQEVLRWTRHMAQGLAAAHAAGVLHRDLKPANVLLDGGVARLCDFGLARRVDRETILTRTGALVGTPRFLAPEIFRGEDASESSDLWSLGATAFEVAYRERWNRPSDLQQLVVTRGKGMGEPDPERFGEHPHLDAVLRRLLHPDPARRPGSAQELIRELEEPRRAARSRGGSAPVASRRPWVRLTMASGAAALLVGLTLGWWGNSQPPPRDPAPDVGEDSAVPAPEAVAWFEQLRGQEPTMELEELRQLAVALEATRSRVGEPGWRVVAAEATALGARVVARSEEPALTGRVLDALVRVQLAHGGPDEAWVHGLEEEVAATPGGAEAPGPARARKALRRGLTARGILEEAPRDPGALRRALDALDLHQLPADFGSAEPRALVEEILPRYLEPTAALRFRRLLVAALLGPRPAEPEGLEAAHAAIVITAAWERLNAAARRVGLAELGQGDAGETARRWAYAWSDYQEVVHDVQAAVSALPRRDWTWYQRSVHLAVAPIYTPSDLRSFAVAALASLEEAPAMVVPQVMQSIWGALRTGGCQDSLGPEGVAEVAVALARVARAGPASWPRRERDSYRQMGLQVVVHAARAYPRELPASLREEFDDQLGALEGLMASRPELVGTVVDAALGTLEGNDADELLGTDTPVERELVRRLGELAALAARRGVAISQEEPGGAEP